MPTILLGIGQIAGAICYTILSERLDSVRLTMVLLPNPTPLGGGKKWKPSAFFIKEVSMENDNTIRRLKTVEGHLRGVIRMVEEDVYCIDIIRQIQAVE